MRLEKLEGIKQGFTSLWESVADGWQRMRQSAAGAMTRFRPAEQANLPAKVDVNDDFYLPSHGWSMLGGDVFEDEQRLVVRLEVPGMETATSGSASEPLLVILRPCCVSYAKSPPPPDRTSFSLCWRTAGRVESIEKGRAADTFSRKAPNVALR